MRQGLALVTPEEVAVHFRVGEMGRRIGALMLDFLVLTALTLALTLPLGFAGFLAGEVAVALAVVLSFLVRVFYFPFFELRWHGRTPGKKKMGLRVVARDGGPLTAGMVFARNLTRELETFLPLTLLFLQGILVELPPWVGLGLLAWILALLLVPMTNWQHLRVGDLVAGTVVVAEPKAVLLDDLTEMARRTRADEEYTFTREQLEIYGIRELQVLERVLRGDDSQVRDDLLMRVADAVIEKIGWEPPLDRPAGRFHAERFLRAFYAAQRSRLEAGLLSGERRERKVR